MNETIRRGNISLAYAISFFMFAAFTCLLLGMALHYDAPKPTRLSVERAPVRDHPFFKVEPPSPEVKAAPQEPPRVQPPVTSGPGFPASRVRSQHLIENWAGSPEAYLLEGRIVLRDFQVQAEGGGMRISGRIWSDFETVDSKGWRVGQVLGVSIEVGLYEISSEIDDRLGPLVPTQWVRSEVSETARTQDIELGVAKFSLPLLSKPLPPGIYRLACKLDIAKQSRACKEALMWVRDLYGVIPNYDQSGHPTGESREVYGSKDHKGAWQDLTENEVCKSQGTLFLGDTLHGGTPTFDSTNVLCRDPSFEVYANLQGLETHRDELDDQYKQQAARDPKTLKRLKDDSERSMSLLSMLAARAGGWMNDDEHLSYAQSLAAAKTIHEAIAAFEDDLTLKYWIALDTFHYAFHTINKAGFNCAIAIEKGDAESDRVAREQRRDEFKDLDKKRARDDKREEAFMYIPEPIKKAAYEYYRRSEETSIFDSASYTRKHGKEVQLDPAKWSAFRVEFLETFRGNSAVALASVDLSDKYAIQKWGEAFKQLQIVRESVFVHAYCYERYLRMISVEKEIRQGGNKNLRADAEKQMLLEWEAEVGVWATEMKPLFDQAKVSPSTVYGRWESASKEARKLLDMPDFAYRYMLSMQEKQVPPPRRHK